MCRRPRRLTFAVAFLTAGVLPGAGAAAADVDYARDVRPILVERCVSCHGPLKQEGGLRLDAGALIRRGGESGPAVVPGDPVGSRLVEAVTGDPAVWRMPPEGGGLPQAEVATLRAWIEGGAASPEDEETPASPSDHWSYRKPVKTASPAPADPRFAGNPVTGSWPGRGRPAGWNRTRRPTGRRCSAG